jgi:hypothetical protein
VRRNAREEVISFEDMKRGGWLVVCGVLASGCASSARPNVILPEAAGVTTVGFSEHLDSTYALEEVVVVLDGAVLHRQQGREMTVPRTLARLQGVAHGDHTLALLVRVSMPCGVADRPRARITLRTSESFTHSGAPTDLAVDVYSGAQTDGFAQRIVARVAHYESGRLVHAGGGSVGHADLDRHLCPSHPEVVSFPAPVGTLGHASY